MSDGIQTEMDGAELKSVRDSLGLSTLGLALQLRTARSTVNDWLSGKSPVPGAAIVALELLRERDKWVMGNLTANLCKRLDEEYPNGIASLPVSNDE